MSLVSRSELFWNAPHKFELVRAVDPLGFDALREAMSNVLAPFLTGATRHAEHYVAVAVGLRWARNQATNVTDKDIWPYFGAFERGLLQYWRRNPSHRLSRNRYLGKRIISEICKEKRPNVERAILVNQRGVGLLGNYVQSLRAIGLVKSGTIEIEEKAVASLLGEARFKWSGASPGSWEAIDAVFANVDVPSSWPRLGRLLFDISNGTLERVRMHQAARTLLSNPKSVTWKSLAASKTLLEPQRRIAAATDPTTALESQLRGLFAELIEGRNAPVTKATAIAVAKRAKRLIGLQVIGTVWPNMPPVAQALLRQIEAAANEKMSKETLLEWHRDVMRARSTVPWIEALGDRSTLKLPTERTEPDFRLMNMRNLLKETRWLA